MATVPQELLDLLNEAQKQLDEATEASTFHAIKLQELEEAMDAEEEAQDNEVVQLQESNATAAVAIAEIKAHFGL